jgi:hypothetical protein
MKQLPMVLEVMAWSLEGDNEAERVKWNQWEIVV